jgi:hypothetical protein
MTVRLSALRAGRPLTSGRFPVIISVRGSVDPGDIVRLEGLGHLKNPVTSSGLETETFLLVAKCLNQLCHWCVLGALNTITIYPHTRANTQILYFPLMGLNVKCRYYCTTSVLVLITVILFKCTSVKSEYR